jgi:DNA mismatch repair protein MutS
MGLELLHPFEFNNLNTNYNSIISIINCIKNNCDSSIICLSENELAQFHEYMTDYTHKFNLCQMENIDLNTNKDEIINYFNKDIIPELDLIQNKINEIELKRKELQLFYHNQLSGPKTNSSKTSNEMVKLVYTENEGYSFSCTKIRYELLLKKVKELEKCRVRYNNNVTKFYPEELLTLCNELINYRDLLHKKVKINYLTTIKGYYNKYNSLFKKIKEFIEIIDVCHSNYKCKQKYNYVQPEIVQSQSAFFEATQLRHPIIERLGTNYIPNDVYLNNETLGILLYGLNSSGKSSILRAIGINIILAQCGLYVPCKQFLFYPFHTIISQVDLTDNLFSGKSSYINETLGLKRILKCANENTLVLCDEMCKGTEYNSSVSLVTSTLLFLLNKSSKIFFTSHLHEVAKQHEIKQSSLLKVCHMDVSIKNGKDIIFERLIRDGIGSELYGLEVAKSLLDEPSLIDIAFMIRNRLVDTIHKSEKRSTYNKRKIIQKCEICKSTKNLETDHIMPQCDTDKEGFINNKHYHKNEVFNLAILCKSCHLKKTQGKIIINGYKDSINGRFLDYIHLDDTQCDTK